MGWAFVTVTYNSRAHLLRHWTQFASMHPDSEWIVVDNASSDGSADLAASLGAHVVRLSQNTGFAHANNRGLRRVASSHVMFVNPDVSIPADLSLAPLERWKNALVAPRLMNVDGSVQDSARGLPYLSRKIRNRLGERIGPHSDYVRRDLATPTRIAWAMGAAVGGPTDLFRTIGGWNDDYFLYYEDHEIGLRAWETGAQVIYDPRVEFVHEWQRATTSFERAAWSFEVRSMRTFYRQYPSLLSTLLPLPKTLTNVRNLQWRPVV